MITSLKQTNACILWCEHIMLCFSICTRKSPQEIPLWYSHPIIIGRFFYWSGARADPRRSGNLKAITFELAKVNATHFLVAFTLKIQPRVFRRSNLSKKTSNIHSSYNVECFPGIWYNKNSPLSEPGQAKPLPARSLIPGISTEQISTKEVPLWNMKK